MDITKKEIVLPFAYAYSGVDMKFTDFNVPGTISTQLILGDLSHIETVGSTVHLVIDEAGKERRISFTNDSFSWFQILLRDRSVLDFALLDEHITLDEFSTDFRPNFNSNY